MPSSIEFKITSEPEGIINRHSGSLFHGLLMENINRDYGEYLHEEGLKPYSQYLRFDRENKKYIWKISALNEEAEREILEPLKNLSDKKVILSNRQAQITLEFIGQTPSFSYKELADRFFLEDSLKRRHVIHFYTPTTFKVNGRYVIFPPVTNIFGSLLDRWNQFFSLISLQDENIKEHLAQFTCLVGYKLQSTKYEMEGVKIPGFLGEICLYIGGPDPLARIALMLLNYAHYSGIGAKTSLGMGGVKVE